MALSSGGAVVPSAELQTTLAMARALDGAFTWLDIESLGVYRKFLAGDSFASIERLSAARLNVDG
jgi:hypothetical protein